jgi:hypothetical protein
VTEKTNSPAGAVAEAGRAETFTLLAFIASSEGEEALTRLLVALGITKTKVEHTVLAVTCENTKRK